MHNPAPVLDNDTHALLADHRIKLKECEKKDKYLDLVRELKKLRNMKVTILPIVMEDLEVGGRVETIKW